MPEPSPAEPFPTSRPILLRNNLLVAALVFVALEFWRPYFFETDDNLDGLFPFLCEIGRHLVAGQTPFVTTHLFGGDYYSLRDPAFFVWHPLYLIVSLLGGTPFYRCMLEVDAFFLLMLANAGFVVLANFLRYQLRLDISDRWIMFFALSYTYSMIALTTGASWLQFLGNHSALPWLAWGILQTREQRGALIVGLFSMHELLGGHLSPTLATTIIFSIFAVGLAISRRSIVPIISWCAGNAMAFVALSVLLLPMLHGFSGSYRFQGIVLQDMQANNIPVEQFPTALFFGMALWLKDPAMSPHVTYTIALGASAAVWCLLPAISSYTGEITTQLEKLCRLLGMNLPETAPEKRTAVPVPTYRFDLVVLVMLLFIGLLICRPVWITEIMMRLPLVRSMRWPFREMLQFQLFLHIFMLVRKPGLSLVARRGCAVFGSLVFILPLLLSPLPPTFNSMTWDRELILGNGFDQYWAQVRPLLKPTDRIAVLIPFNLYTDDRFEEPYSLLGSYNYTALAGTINAWGYSPAPPLDQVYTRTYAFYPFGAYRPEQKAALMAEKPDLKFITLESLHPLKITLSSRDGPTIDLTPFIPPRVSKALPPDSP